MLLARNNLFLLVALILLTYFISGLHWSLLFDYAVAEIFHSLKPVSCAPVGLSWTEDKASSPHLHHIPLSPRLYSLNFQIKWETYSLKGDFAYNLIEKKSINLHYMVAYYS